jgi:hypothetical protein
MRSVIFYPPPKALAKKRRYKAAAPIKIVPKTTLNSLGKIKKNATSRKSPKKDI